MARKPENSSVIPQHKSLAMGEKVTGKEPPGGKSAPSTGKK